MAIWLRWGVRKKYEHQPHAKRPQCAPLQSHIKANRKTLQSARRPWLGRLPDAWCRRRRPLRTGQWQLPSRRANQGSRGRRPLHQCVGKESSRHLLTLSKSLTDLTKSANLSDLTDRCTKATGMAPKPTPIASLPHVDSSSECSSIIAAVHARSGLLAPERGLSAASRVRHVQP
jgi:hypothetical protein